MGSIYADLRERMPTAEEEEAAARYMPAVLERVKTDYQKSICDERDVILRSAQDRALSNENAEIWRRVLSDFVEAKRVMFIIGSQPERYLNHLPEREKHVLFSLVAGQFLQLQQQMWDVAANLVQSKYAQLVPYFYIHISYLSPERQRELMQSKKKLSAEWNKYLKRAGIVRAKGKRGNSTKDEYLIAYDLWKKVKRNGERKHSLPEIIRLTNRTKYGNEDFHSADGHKLIRRFREAMRRLDKNGQKDITRATKKRKRVSQNR